MENKNTLGQAIAYLHYCKVNGYKLTDLKKDVADYLEIIKTRLENLELSPEHIYSLMKNNPNSDYRDLFLSIFLNDNFDKNNMELIKFFNDNLECFEEYSIVLNDFIQKSEDLKTNQQVRYE